MLQSGNWLQFAAQIIRNKYTHVVVCAKNDPSNLNLYMIYHSFNLHFLGYSIPFLHSLHMFQSFCRHERVKPCVEVSIKSKGAISNIRCIFAWRKEMYPNNQLHYLQMDLTQLWCYLHHKWCRSFPLHVDRTKWASSLCGSGPKSLIEVLIVWFLRTSINFSFTER